MTINVPETGTNELMHLLMYQLEYKDRGMQHNLGLMHEIMCELCKRTGIGSDKSEIAPGPVTSKPKAKYVVTGTLHFGNGFNLEFVCENEVKARRLAEQFIADNAEDYARNSQLSEICIETVEEE